MIKKHKINHSFDCNNKCLIYLLSCKSCSKQYVGNTTNHFRSKWNNYTSDVRKVENSNMKNVKQKFFQSHFLQCDHQGFLKDIEVWLTDKMQASDLTKDLCILTTSILKVTISSLFKLIHTFTVVFGSPSTRALSSVTAIVFF